MKTQKFHRLLAVVGVLAIAACDETSNPAGPEFDEFEQLLSVQDEMELAVLADPAAIDAAIEMVTASGEVAMMRGNGRVRDGDYASRARLRFQNAQDALGRGERRAALDEARLARRVVAAGIQAAGGASAIASLVERVEDLAITVAGQKDDFVDADALAVELGVIAASARSALNRGDMAEAGERAVLADQRVRDRRGQDGRRDRVTAARAEVAVALGGHAVALAERLLADGVSDEQARFLATAYEFLAKAREAFDAGHYVQAVHAAQSATWHALKAVVVPDGITDEEAREIVELASGLLEEARAALGDAPTELEQKLFERAARLLELAEAKLADGHLRGVGAAWQSAVISSYLIG